MGQVEQAVATQLANIEKRTGKSLQELTLLVQASGLSRHAQLVAHLKSTLGLGHGDANTLAHMTLKTDAASRVAAAEQAGVDVLDTLYTGAKAALRPLHDAVMAQLGQLGEFEIAPKKTYLSLRRRKQFAMLGPATNTQIELGLNSKLLVADARLKALPAGGMCNFKLRLSSLDEVDAQLLDWVRQAFDEAG